MSWLSNGIFPNQDTTRGGQECREMGLFLGESQRPFRTFAGLARKLFDERASCWVLEKYQHPIHAQGVVDHLGQVLEKGLKGEHSREMMTSITERPLIVVSIPIQVRV